MTTETPQPPIETDNAPQTNERNVLLVTYVLYGLSCFFLKFRL